MNGINFCANLYYPKSLPELGHIWLRLPQTKMARFLDYFMNYQLPQLRYIITDLI